MAITRRELIQSVAAAALVSASGVSFAADTIKIGYVSPQTGPLAPFGEADKWVIEQMKGLQRWRDCGRKEIRSRDSAQRQPVEPEPRWRSRERSDPER